MLDRRRPRALLLDLDGTLADTALDLVAAVQAVCVELGQPVPDHTTLRHLVSGGGPALLKAALGLERDTPAYRQAYRRVIARYAREPAVRTRLFDGMCAVLERAHALQIPWAVVTNKAEPLARLVMHGLDLPPGCAGLVAASGTAHAKPDPQPLRLAGYLCGVDPATTLFVGDDRRDVVAGRAAGAGTVAATWGYLAPDAAPASWGADAVIDAPVELLQWLV